ncbi:MAG: hypothetical protein QOH10_237 [Actinomycetota bacterium]|nr:hypothetical protein [Actinomycetota bacterium]
MKGFGGLLGAELRRFFSRRVMRAAFAFGIALSTLVIVIVTARSDFRNSTEHVAQLVCPGAPTTVPATISPEGGQIPPNCFPQFAAASVRHDHRIKIHDNLSATIKGTGFAMVFIAIVIGATFVGAEFGAGSLSTQLIYEPRRVRVVAVKAIAVGIGLAVLAVALLLYIGLLQWVGSSLRGVVSGLDGTWFAARAGDVARVASAVALAGMAAYAITVVARRTVAAVAGLLIFGWASAFIGQFHNWRWVAKYNPATAFIAMVVDVSPRNNSEHNVLAVRGATISACAWAVGLTVVAAIIFDRREVR